MVEKLYKKFWLSTRFKPQTSWNDSQAVQYYLITHYTTLLWDFLIVNAIWLSVQKYQRADFVQSKYPKSAKEEKPHAIINPPPRRNKNYTFKATNKKILTWKNKIKITPLVTEIIFLSAHSSSASRHPLSFIIFETSLSYKTNRNTKLQNKNKQRSAKNKECTSKDRQIDRERERKPSILDTCNTITPTVTAATGTKLLSIHSSPALKQPLSNMCLSPGFSQQIKELLTD